MASFGRGGGPGGGPGNGFVVNDQPPSELYPKITVPIQSQIAPLERQAVGQFLALREAIKDGPLSTGSSVEAQQERGKRVVVEVEGMNDGIKRYSDRYLKKRKIGRSVDEHPYVVRFFPEELHKIMGISKIAGKQKRNLQISKFTRELINAERAVVGEEGDGKSEKTKSLLSKLARQDGDGDDDNEEGDESEDVDEEFSSDDNDDYNAEKYFENDDFGEDHDFGEDEAAF